MGSHLYCGIATSLGVIKRKGKASKQELDEIDKALHELFDFTIYDVVRTNEFTYLTIKKDVVNDNIHALRIELGKNLYLSGFLLYSDDYLRENREKEEWSTILKEVGEDVRGKYKSDVIDEEEHRQFISEGLYYFDFSPLLRRNIEFFRDYHFIIKVRPLSMNSDKIICKNKMEIMCLLNWFKRDYFKNRLNGSIIFYIR